MEHSDVREMLEDAAIEPDGLERLMAGDTPAASLVAGHLAGCPDCAEELERLQRSVALIRPTVRAVPSPELRARTLAYVAAIGRPRGTGDVGSADFGSADFGSADVARPFDVTTTKPASGEGPAGTADAVPLVPPQALPRVAAAGDASAAARDRRNRVGWLVAMAAALIVAVTGTGLVANATSESRASALSAEIEALGDVTRWTLRVDAQTDVRRLQLASATGAATSASLVYSPSSTELVIVADELAAPSPGKEYRCWVEVGGTRSTIGKMFFGGELAYWVGKVREVAGISADAKFGVSLVDIGGPGASGAPGDSVLISD
jgi:hypothetical protein